MWLSELIRQMHCTVCLGGAAKSSPVVERNEEIKCKSVARLKQTKRLPIWLASKLARRRRRRRFYIFRRRREKGHNLLEVFVLDEPKT